VLASYRALGRLGALETIGNTPTAHVDRCAVYWRRTT
jgi:hypothetical protein